MTWKIYITVGCVERTNMWNLSTLKYDRGRRANHFEKSRCYSRAIKNYD